VEAYSRQVSQSIDSSTVNICTGRAVYLADILKIMDEILGHNLKIVMDPALFRGDEPRFIVETTTHLETMVGPLPDPEFRETLPIMYETICRQRG
jgi:hypothetical protein